ncbi:hypothetical protein MTO96_028329 [Rhipicephalus appendiculatus]
MDESAIPKDLASVFRMIEQDKDDMLSWLKELVAIPTVSAELGHRKDIMRLIEQTQEKLKKYGVHVILEPLGDQKLSDGSKVPYPPLLLASTTHDAKRKTLCVTTDGIRSRSSPWRRMAACTVAAPAHNKGPLTACIWALCAYLQTAGRPPLNVRMMIDSMQEVDSQGIAAYLMSSKKSDLLGGIDYVCIADGVWLRPKTPCLTYALRGICHFQGGSDLRRSRPSFWNLRRNCVRVAYLRNPISSSGSIEAMPDLMFLLNSLTDAEGRIKVPGIYDEVLPLTHEERKVYEGIEFDVEEYRKELGVPRLATTDKVELLMRRWRYPTLSIHGVEGAHWSTGDKAVIPARVVGKFSIRTVPNQKAQKVRECVEKHLQEQFKRRGSPNQVKVITSHCADPWYTDPSGPNFQAAEAAVKDAYGVVPDKTRGGFTVGPAKLIQDHVCRDMLVMPINPPGCGFHSQNENISVADLVSGAKLFAAYMHELSKLK